jgi:hypothetical protein
VNTPATAPLLLKKPFPEFLETDSRVAPVAVGAASVLAAVDGVGPRVTVNVSAEFVTVIVDKTVLLVAEEDSEENVVDADEKDDVVVNCEELKENDELELSDFLEVVKLVRVYEVLVVVWVGFIVDAIFDPTVVEDAIFEPTVVPLGLLSKM